MPRPPPLRPLIRAVTAAPGGGVAVSHIPPPCAGPGQVRLAVAATAVNRADLLQAAGAYPPPPGVTPVLGLEAAGIVLDAPPSTGLAAGDRVAALLQGGGYADVAVADGGCVVRLPEAWGDDREWAVRGAAVMEAWVAAYQCLLLGGCMRPRAGGDAGADARGVGAPWAGVPPAPPRPPPPQSVLVTAAASGVGTAAVQLAASHFGVPTVIGSASTPDRRAAVAALGATATVPRPPTLPPSRGEACAYMDGVRAAAPGGVGLVLDAVGGGGAWAAHEGVLAPDGSWVLYAALGGGATGGPISIGRLLSRRLTVTATTLRGRPRAYREGLVAAFGREVLPALAGGQPRRVERRMTPIIHRVMGLEEAADAHALLASNTVIGKIVLRVTDD